MMKEAHKKITIETLTKGNVWTLNEAELSHIIIEGKKREDYSEYEAHYMNIIRPVFDVQYLNREDEKRVAELEKEVPKYNSVVVLYKLIILEK